MLEMGCEVLLADPAKRAIVFCRHVEQVGFVLLGKEMPRGR